MEFKKHYLDYEEYRYLGGTLEMAPFNVLELEAQKIIDKYTSGRLKELDDQINEVKVCCYRLIELLGSYDTYTKHDKSISSENIDGYSIRYGGGNENVFKTKLNEIKGIVRDELSECYLDDGTPYLYTGVDK